MVQQKLFSFNTIERGNQEVSARGGLIVFDGFLKVLKTEEYTMYIDPTIIDLGYKSEAQMTTYTGIKGDRPILVGLRELPIFVHVEYREGNATGGILKAAESAYKVVESKGNNKCNPKG